MKKASILFLLIGSLAFTQQIKFEEYDLDNGLHVILHQNNTNPVVAVSVLYHVGSKNENPERTGFAHFFEHLLFEGSANIQRGEFGKYIAEAGGKNNANTSKDRTFYYEVFPSNQLGLGIWLESERMLHAKVLKEGIETQRQVVKEEKRLRVDNQPYSDAFQRVLWEGLYKKHPYKWATIGSMEHLDAATESDYVNFYKTFYVPNNATLSIAGDFDVASTKKMIQEYFGTIPRGKIPITRPNVQEDPMTAEVVMNYDDKNAQIPAIMYGYRAPKQADNDAYVLEIISNILSNGESSRMTKNIVNKKQEAVATGSFLWGLEDGGTLIIYGMVNKGIEVKKLESSIDEEIDNLLKNGITQKELDTQLNKMEKDFISKNTSNVGIAENLANYHVYFKDANLINTEIQKYQKITTEDVKRVANKYLNKTQRVKLYVNPVTK